MNRSQSLDFARIIFSFLVVVIHVPLMFNKLLLPLAYCAVPFFYLLTGYFLYNSNEDEYRKRIKKSLKSYSKMWLVYFIIQACLTTFLRIIYDNELTITNKDILDQIIFYGNCHALDVVHINNIDYGTSALWFLYSGAISLGILLLTSFKESTRRLLVTATIVLHILFVIINYQGGMIIPRTIGVSLPYLLIGTIIRQKNTVENSSLKQLLCCSLISLAGLYIEAKLFGVSYSRIFLLPASVCLFALITKIKFNFGSFLNHIPVRVTLDVYVWHRLIYCMVAGVLSINLNGIDAFIVFCITFIISLIIRKSWIYLKYHSIEAN